MQITQIVYKHTVSYKPYHSLSVEATANVESNDDIDKLYGEISSWVSNKLKESAQAEAPDRPKAMKPEDMY